MINKQSIFLFVLAMTDTLADPDLIDRLSKKANAGQPTGTLDLVKPPIETVPAYTINAVPVAPEDQSRINTWLGSSLLSYALGILVGLAVFLGLRYLIRNIGSLFGDAADGLATLPVFDGMNARDIRETINVLGSSK